MEKIKASSVAWAWPWERSLHWVSHWTLFACILQITRAAIGSTLALPDLQLLTPAQAANAVALHDATLWLNAAGAGPAFVAMLLGGCGRVRRALAGVALASAVATHCVLACLMGATLVTGPSEGLLAATVIVALGAVFYATLDASAALILLRRPPGEKEE